MGLNALVDFLSKEQIKVTYTPYTQRQSGDTANKLGSSLNTQTSSFGGGTAFAIAQSITNKSYGGGGGTITTTQQLTTGTYTPPKTPGGGLGSGLETFTLLSQYTKTFIIGGEKVTLLYSLWRSNYTGKTKITVQTIKGTIVGQ